MHARNEGYVKLYESSKRFKNIENFKNWWKIPLDKFSSFYNVIYPFNNQYSRYIETSECGKQCSLDFKSLAVVRYPLRC